MQNQIIVYKGRTNTLLVALGLDVSNDTITSQVRVDKDRESELIFEWVVDFVGDGTDGELVLVNDNAISDDLEYSKGWMDFKRVTNGEPIPVMDEPIEVLIREPVTA